MKAERIVARLDQLAGIFATVESPDELADAMIEGGIILAVIVEHRLLPFNGIVAALAQTASEAAENAKPRWDTSVADHACTYLWYHVGEEWSDRPRGKHHIVSQRDSAVVRETRWAEDYKHQGKRYALLCSELAAELPADRPESSLVLTAADHNRMLQIVEDMQLDRRLETEGKASKHDDRKKVYGRLAQIKKDQAKRAKQGKPDLYRLAKERIDQKQTV